MDQNSTNNLEIRQVEERAFIIHELLYRLASSFIPEEILRDGIDKETKAILIDVALATAIMLFIVFSDKCCFRIPTKRQLAAQTTALEEEAEYDELT